MKTRWIDRTILIGPRVSLATNQQTFEAAKRAAGVQCTDPWLEPGWNACTHAYSSSDGLVCIVTLDMAAAVRMTPIDVAALLAHEAVHVWQRMADHMGGGDLGRELPAYAVENIAAGLMREYARLITR